MVLDRTAAALSDRVPLPGPKVSLPRSELGAWSCRRTRGGASALDDLEQETQQRSLGRYSHGSGKWATPHVARGSGYCRRNANNKEKGNDPLLLPTEKLLRCSRSVRRREEQNTPKRPNHRHHIRSTDRWNKETL